MRAVQTENTDCKAILKGGTEENDLWYYRMEAQDPDVPGMKGDVICTVWVPTHEERERIANGENVRMILWYDAIPPMAMDVTPEKVLGRNA